MGTYLSDWAEAEEGAAYAHAMNPDCTLERDCPAPADGHILTCRRFRAEQFEEAKRRYARSEAVAQVRQELDAFPTHTEVTLDKGLVKLLLAALDAHKTDR